MKLRDEIISYGKSIGYIPTQFDEIICECGATRFEMFSDDDEGGCGLICQECGAGLSIMDSADYMENPLKNTCSCGNEILHVVQGLSFYDDSNDVRWVYVGAECDKCDVKGVYVDWQER